MFIINVFKAIILGIVEGITEWLPISSTGHMILVNEFLHTADGFFGSQIFLYVIQLGAILAIVTLYFRKLNPFSPSKSAEEKADTWQMWFKVIVACVPAAVIGLLLNDFMDTISTPFVVSVMLIVYGAAFIIVENSLSYRSVSGSFHCSGHIALGRNNPRCGFDRLLAKHSRRVLVLSCDTRYVRRKSFKNRYKRLCDDRNRMVSSDYQYGYRLPCLYGGG